MTEEQIQSLKDVALAAEILLQAMTEAEYRGTDFRDISHPVLHLTNCILECYRTEALKNEPVPEVK